MSGWVTKPDQAAMFDLDAMMWKGNSSVQVTCTALRKEEKKKKLEINTPKQLQVGFDALMYMCLIKIKLLKSPDFHFVISALVYMGVWILWRFPMGVHKIQSDGQNCV